MSCPSSRARSTVIRAAIDRCRLHGGGRWCWASASIRVRSIVVLFEASEWTSVRPRFSRVQSSPVDDALRRRKRRITLWARPGRHRAIGPLSGNCINQVAGSSLVDDNLLSVDAAFWYRLRTSRRVRRGFLKFYGPLFDFAMNNATSVHGRRYRGKRFPSSLNTESAQQWVKLMIDGFDALAITILCVKHFTFIQIGDQYLPFRSDSTRFRQWNVSSCMMLLYLQFIVSS